MGTTIIYLILSLSGATWAENKYTPEQLKARFYFDLGSAEVDVSSYPKKQQDNYKIFTKTCSQCHTLARPINSPIVERKDWKRFIQRMHLKTKVVRDTVISDENAEAVTDFLAYDAQIRKVKNKADFDAKTKELQALFEDIKKERSQIQIEQDKKKIKEAAPYTGTK